MLVNAALDVAPYDPRPSQSRRRGARPGRENSSQSRRGRAGRRHDHAVTFRASLARHVLGVLIGLKGLARVRPEHPLLDGVVSGCLVRLIAAETAAPF